MLPQLIYVVRFISCNQTPEDYYLCTIVSNTLVFMLYFIFLLAFTHRRSYSLQTIKLKYFLLRDFRTTKVAVLSQNIQIYHISQVNMAYCLVMIVWLLHWSNVVLSRLSSSPKYCTFRQDAIFCSLYAIKLPSLCFIGRNLEAACVRFPNAYYFLNRNLEVVWVKYL